MPRADALLKSARAALGEVETPALDARLLLQHVLDLPQAQLIAEPSMEIADQDAERFAALVQRRRGHEPISRITGRREFFGRVFAVTPDVLDPRPDTEVLVETALALLPGDASCRVLDLGTGSGIIAVTLLAERPLAKAVAVDLSAAAIAVAGKNAAAHAVKNRIEFLNASWFADVSGLFDAILSNPPYIEDSVIPKLEEEVRNHDPHLALAGGADGLSCYRAIAAGALPYLTAEGFVCVEIGAGQAESVTAIFAANGLYAHDQHHDLGGHVRCLVFCQSQIR